MTSSSSNTTPIRVAFIQATWHADIVNQARDGFLGEMARQNVERSSIDVFELPGAFEIPLHAKKLAQSGKFDAIVACGLVVDGGIYRHDFVANAVIQGLMSVQLDTGVPVFSAVLTPHHFHSHDEHQQFFGDHFVQKGVEVARACLNTVESLRKLPAI
jgi:6,7-dimethyl-8-ribityllumazine synthase